MKTQSKHADALTQNLSSSQVRGSFLNNKGVMQGLRLINIVAGYAVVLGGLGLLCMIVVATIQNS